MFAIVCVAQRRDPLRDPLIGELEPIAPIHAITKLHVLFNEGELERLQMELRV